MRRLPNTSPNNLCCSFDDVFDENVDNHELYTTAIQPLIATVFK